MNLINFVRNNKKSIKNQSVEEYELPRNLDGLNKWTIPRIPKKLLYELGTFEDLGLIQTVKTSEETITLENQEMVIKLLNESDIIKYQKDFNFLHIGLIQIAFKPMTLQGLPESFLAVLRDGRNLNWKQSLMGIMQTSLAHGPVYFDVYPNLQLSLTDANILEALTLNIKTHGYNYMPGSELICVCFRIYFKPLVTMNPKCKRVDKQRNETVLIESNFNRSKISTRKVIKWEEIEFPTNWVMEQGVPVQPKIENNITNISQSSDGTVKIEFFNEKEESLIRRSRSNRSVNSHFSPLDYYVENISATNPSRASTSQVNERRVEGLRIYDNIVQGIYNNNEEINAS